MKKQSLKFRVEEQTQRDLTRCTTGASAYVTKPEENLTYGAAAALKLVCVRMRVSNCQYNGVVNNKNSPGTKLIRERSIEY